MIVFLAFALASAIPEDLHFEKWFTAHGVQVEIARRPGSPPWLRSTAELTIGADRVGSALTDFAHYKEFFAPAVKKADVLEAGEGNTRIHLIWAYPFPLRNRDAVVSYRAHRAGDGRFVLSWKDDARAGDPHEGIRIEHVAGETIVEALGADRCRITYTYLGELGGKFPAWAEEKAWREEPVQYIRAIRRRLKLPDPP